MSKCNCDICGEEFTAYGKDPFAGDKTDGVAIRVYDKKTGHFNIKHYRTCRNCATAVRAYADKLTRELRGA